MERATESEAIIRWLARPESYSHRPDRVEHLETHISHVFLAGSYVYKLKKPVRFDFLDFSTPESRKHACEEEVRLNRRLAPETYVDVLSITRNADGAFQFGGNGQIVDWLVQMRRLPTELTLEALYQRDKLCPEHVDRLAAVLSRFYQSLTPLPLSPEEYRQRYLAHVRSNRQELLAVGHYLSVESVRRIHGFQLQLLSLQRQIFDERVRSGRIVDGHGDLRPEHICLSDPLTIFDCIEFSPEFRTIDVADELAFLGAECDFLGADWVGPQLLRSYQQQSGDHPPTVLWDFYKSYRACVRAKVSALRADQLQGGPQESAINDAQRHLALADNYATPWLRPLTIAIGGLAGTGKTTLASALADALGAELLRTDVLRRERFGAGTHAAEIDGGIYGREAREQIYSELNRRAAALRADRISVVLDGTFSSLALIEQARKSAQGSSTFIAIECVCRPETAHERIRCRLSAGRDASEAWPGVHDIQRKRWESWPTDIRQIRVDTERALQEQVEQVMGTLRDMAE